jgi:hypothetical protein
MSCFCKHTLSFFLQLHVISTLQSRTYRVANTLIKYFCNYTLFLCLTTALATESSMEDNPGVDMEDDVFEAPSPIEMELHEDGAHAEHPT